jgi:PIN domain nuclease of toxin-antitoxin system
MAAVVADTHSAIWYLLVSGKLSQNALDAFDHAARLGDPIYLASLSLVEVIYLVEKKRLPEIALDRLNSALTGGLPGFVLGPLDLAVAQAVRHIPRDLIPDMPDRIIAATALHLNLPLVTCDHKLHAAGIPTIW